MNRTRRITVNGVPRALDGVPAHVTALDWLRDLGLTGAKEGCAEGECGACSVMVARPAADGASQWTAINACLVPALALDGQEVVTAEGLGTPDDLHPVQREMAERGGSQCGYCTPGFVCSMAAEFYRRDRAPGDGDAEHGPNGFDLHALSGNLCRCTGYRPIRDAAWALGRCPQPATRSPSGWHGPPPTSAADPGRRVRRGPADLAEALALLAERPDATVSPAAPTGASRPTSAARGRRTSSRSTGCRSCAAFDVGDDVVNIGAALTLSEVETLLAGAGPAAGRGVPAVRLPADPQRRDHRRQPRHRLPDRRLRRPRCWRSTRTSCWRRRAGEREVPLADYFTGYRETVRRPDELIRAVRVPLPAGRVIGFHKIAKRRCDDISSVAIGVRDRRRRRRRRAGRGSASAASRRPRSGRWRPRQALEGQPWTEETVARGRRGDARRGHPDRRPSGQRGLPVGDARQRAAAAVRRDHGGVPA